MNSKILLYSTLLMLLTKCSETETITEIVEVEKIVTETITQLETVTVTNTVYVLPEEYSFTRDGVSTVFYSGQTARLRMASELKSAMNNISYTQEQINNMFSSGTGFTDATLDASGKNVRGKTATSPIAQSTVRPLFDSWIEEFTTVVAPAVTAGTTASSGVAGSYTEADGSRTVKVTSKGFELNQVFSKGLIGALQVDQIINNYLSFSKLDGAREDNDAGIYAYTHPAATEASITKMEHYWDEGFGYLQGLDSQFKSGLGTAPNKDSANLNYYLNKINGQDNEAGISDAIYNAFIAGRAAIVNKDYEERDKQAGIISAEISKVIGYKAHYYLVGGAEDITNGDWASALHALSEAYGFILGLQFTKDSSGNPYMTNTEVNDLLSRLSAGDGGFWERTVEELNTMADEVATATGGLTN
jgi:hypothetical protein